ncbi:hypothetical protein ACPXCS_08110 [Streptomyces sp. DT190]|uniref:hypothetical protein n=1 Tax=unclassified Streptomyces TaxID=2593676 RepID=UPI003CF4D8E5
MATDLAANWYAVYSIQHSNLSAQPGLQRLTAFATAPSETTSYASDLVLELIFVRDFLDLIDQIGAAELHVAIPDPAVRPVDLAGDAPDAVGREDLLRLPDRCLYSSLSTLRAPVDSGSSIPRFEGRSRW